MGQVFTGANLILTLGKHPNVGVGAEVSLDVLPTYNEVLSMDPGQAHWIGPELGPIVEGGWVFGRGGFFSAGGNAGLAVLQGYFDGLGYVPLVQTDFLMGYQWASTGSGLRLGGKLSATRENFWPLGSIEVTVSRKTPAIGIGPRLGWVPGAIDNGLQ